MRACADERADGCSRKRHTFADKNSSAKTSSSQMSVAGSKTAAKSGVKSKGKRTKSASSRRRGQQKIDSQRTQQIQEALARSTT